MSKRLALTGMVAACMLASLASAQEQLADRTLPEMGGGGPPGTLNVSVQGSVTSILWHENADGDALYQGDILLGTAERLAGITEGSALMELDSAILFGLGRRDVRSRWPDGVVRYRIRQDLPARHRVHTAIAAWEAATNIRFEQIAQPDGNYIEFVPASGCSSFVGMVGGRQPVNLAAGCTTGNTIHEIGHALGLHHEQARDDRDSHVRILTANIIPGVEGNFRRDPINFQDIGNYCHGSIMHYGPYAFSRQPNVLKTIETTPPGIAIGQRDRIAPCDIETIHSMYPPAAAADDVSTGFSGELRLSPEGCQANGKCNLAADIFFTDPWRVIWKAPARDAAWPETTQSGTTDGASIPRWARPIIGQPFDEQYLLAAVVHDHYCYRENLVRSWRDTHRMFYDALNALNVPPVKAKIMYSAVYLGGPKWVELVPGEHCGPNCIFDASMQSENHVRRDDSVIFYRDAQHQDEELLRNFEMISKVIEAVPEISVTDIETILNTMQSDDLFFNNGSRVVPAGPDDPVLQ